MRSRLPQALLLLLAAVAAGAAHSSCAREVRPIVPQPKVYSPVGDYYQCLSDARGARDRAYSLSAPSTAELDAARSNEDAVSAILRRWATVRRDATVEAELAYEKALRAARGPAEEAETRGELAELWLSVQEDIEIALFAAAPAVYRDDPSLVSYVQIDIVDTLRPLRDKVGYHIDHCRRLQAEYPALGAATQKCDTASRRLAETSGPHGAPSRLVDAGAPPASLPATGVARAIIPTTHPTPCTFKGSLVVRGAVYAEATGGAPAQTLEGKTPIEVDALEVAKEAGGRYKVKISWPSAREGYLEAQEPPFVLKRQVDIVPAHVWMPHGERVAASEPRGPTVRVVRGFEPEGAAPAKGAARLDKRLFCHDIDLATSTAAPRALPGGGSVRFRGGGPVPLHAAPGGREVAKVLVSEVQLVERRGAFAHVSAATPLGLDGWVKNTLLLAEGDVPK